jgi:hypothetical protein
MHGPLVAARSHTAIRELTPSNSPPVDDDRTTKPDHERGTATGRMAGTGAGHDGEGGGLDCWTAAVDLGNDPA